MRAVRRRRRPAHAVPEDRAGRRRAGRRRRPARPTSTRSASPPARRPGGRTRWPAPGIEFCKLAIVDTKNRARDLVAELERRFPDLDVPITVNVNGCPNACARTQVADIGLKGQLVMDGDRQVEGFQVHLGGATGLQAELRPQAARPQGDQRRARRLRHDVVVATSWPTARTTSRSRPGSPAPTRSCSAARARQLDQRGVRGRVMSERAVPFHCPYCGDEDLRPHEDQHGHGGVGVPGLPARVLAEAARAASDPAGVEPMTALTTAPGPRPSAAPTPRAAAPRSCASWCPTSAPSSSSPRPRTSSSGPSRRSATASASPRRWATPCSPTSPRGSRRASTWSSSTPATTSPRRSAPPTPSGATMDVNLIPITPGPVGRRAGRGVRPRALQARPRPVLRAPQGAAPQRGAPGVRRLGDRPAPRGDPQPGHRAGGRLGRQEVRRSRCPRSRGGPTTTSSSYVAEHGVLVNPLVYDGYPSIGCAPCTRRVAPGEDPRSGRWAGTHKTECGIHS